MAQDEGYVFSTALRYEFPLLLILFSKRYSDFPRRKVREWMGKHAFFSNLKDVTFQAHPYHYCALVSNCKDHFESVTERYKDLSSLSPREMVTEHKRTFRAKFPKDYHVSNKDSLLNLRQDYALLADLTPRLWGEVLRFEWQETIEPTLKAKASRMSSMLRRYPLRRFIEEYTRLHYKTDIYVHPSWTQFGGMVFYEHSKPAISIEMHEEESHELLRVFAHESLHILSDQEGFFNNRIVVDLTQRITDEPKSHETEAGPHYVLGLNYVMETLIEAVTLRIIRLNIDPMFIHFEEKFPLLLPIVYKRLIDIHESSNKTLIQTLPIVLERSLSKL